MIAVQLGEELGQSVFDDGGVAKGGGDVVIF